VPPKTSKKRRQERADPLAVFDERIGRWFLDTIGAPSEIQASAWPVIAEGGHVLMTAPTGSGKTLAAFLWSLNQLLTGRWPGHGPRVLYVSPLKALNTDVRRNLLAPLAELLPLFTDGEGRRPTIRVLTRSGDTPQSERRRMLRQPPEILITTPESLNLLLNSRGGQSLLGGLRTVILDEIHAVAGTKRGTHLITAVERLVPLCGEFQRVALSATVQPLDTIADFVGGYTLGGPVEAPVYAKRRVEIIQAAGHKTYRVKIHYPASEENQPKKDSIWEPLADAFHTKTQRNRSTLIFTNSRKLSEKMAFLVNTAAREMVAYAHHGSLARDLRQQVEERLKAGELKAVFATSSLELGIDIGQLDEVALLQTPPSISSAVQRAGRAGHQVGAASHASIYCTHPGDLVPAAVLGRAVIHQEIEPLVPIQAPLDILAQVLVGMVALEAVDRRDLYNQIRCAAPYHGLGERQFELVLDMLTGRYAHTRVRELKARIAVDVPTGKVQARKGALQALYMSGGTIPDRGYYTLRHHKSGSRIGELDEEFVWEAKTGQVFTLGTQNWQVRKITASDVFVRPAPGNRVAPPFWKADSGGRDHHFATRIAEFLEWIDGRLDDPAKAADLSAELQHEYHLDLPAAERLIAWLAQQRRHTGCRLPHRHHVVVERIHSGPGGAPGSQLALHTPWGGRLNWPLALALEAAIESAFGQAPEVFACDDLILVINPPEIDTDRLISLVDGHRLLLLLRQRLERSGTFGARFRTAAGRALLLTRGGMKRRMPLWMTRLKAQKLMAAVMDFEDFPLLLEAWRTCLRDSFDLEDLKARLDELERGRITVSEVTTVTPSPMARAAAWGQINEYMYRDDGARMGDSKEGGRSKLKEDLLREVVYSQSLRPQVSPQLVAAFCAKRQRLAQGYAPADALELVEWVRDRLILPVDEWQRLLEAMRRDHGVDSDALLERAEGRLVLIRLSKNRPGKGLVTVHDLVPSLASAFWEKSPEGVEVRSLSGTAAVPAWSKATAHPAFPPEPLLGQWLSYYGPVTTVWIEETLGVRVKHLSVLVETLIRDEHLISGDLLEPGGGDQVCDAETYDILLRLGRAGRRDEIQTLPLADLPLLLAEHQGLCSDGQGGGADTAGGGSVGPAAVSDHLARLSGWPAPAAQWETEILPARLGAYQPSWLDAVLQEGEIIWRGCGPDRLTFCYHDELDLLAGPPTPAPGGTEETDSQSDLPLMADTNGARYPFESLLGEQSRDRAYAWLWRRVWEGALVNDGFQAVRQGIANRFKWPVGRKSTGMAVGAARPGRRRMAGRRPTHSYGQLRVPGNWYFLSAPPAPTDGLESLEVDKERIRLLLGRYGILFRPLLERELGVFAWGRLFRALRLMELAGEVVGGHFIDGAPGPQFISRELGRTLTRGLDRERVYFLNATDPASCCGLGLDWGGDSPPARRATTHLVYHGNRLVLVSRRQGRSLSIHVDFNDEHIFKYLKVIEQILKYKVNSSSGVVIESINGEAAPRSPYLAALKARFEVALDPNSVTVYGQWTSSA
jgi:ATP-dependent Lhr-like helicase